MTYATCLLADGPKDFKIKRSNNALWGVVICYNPGLGSRVAMSKRLVCLLALLLCAPMFAQEFQAGIRGIVKDSQGAVVPGVPIEAQNLATNEISRATTNGTGLYAFPVLPIGTYRVTVAATGFKKAVRDKLELRVGDQVQQDFTLEVGAVTEEVTVSAEAELLQEVASEKGQVVGQENVADLPAQARNPFLLGIVATGVQYDIGGNQLSRSARPFDAGNNVAETMSINGGRTGASDLLLDGVPNTGVETGSSATNQAFVPTPEAVAEYKIQSSNYDAQYGRTSGGTMTVSTKAGGNQLHGAVYWLNKNTITSANTFDANHSGTARTPYHENNPGLEFDGPIYHSASLRRPQQDLLHVFVRDLARLHSDTQRGNSAVTGSGGGELQHHAAKQRPGHHDLRPADRRADRYQHVHAAAVSGRHDSAEPHEPGGAQAGRLHSRAKPAGFTKQPGSHAQYADGRLDAHVIRIDQQINEKEHFFSRFVRGFRTEISG